MAFTVISAKYPPHIDPTRCTLAYGDRAVPRLNRELNSSKLIVRQRALMGLCDYLHDPEHISSCLREGIPLSLKNLLTEADVTCRWKALECLFVISSHAIGREAFCHFDVISEIAKLFDDLEDQCRFAAHQTMRMVSEGPHGVHGILEADLIPKLVEKLKSESDNIIEILLDTIHFCLRLDTERALEENAMEEFTKLLQHDWVLIRSKAARAMMDLSVPLDGKNRAVACGAVPLLVELLSDADENVRANAAGALMTITITTEGKYAALSAGAFPSLIKLVNDLNSEVRNNALKALTCLSEAPEGRKQCLEVVETIRVREGDAVPAVAKCAEIAVKVIEWKP